MRKSLHKQFPVGHAFGGLTVAEYLGSTKGRAMYRFSCKCGGEKVASIGSVKDGRVKSCGCAKLSVCGPTIRSHGMCDHELYSVWLSMMTRCYHKGADNFRWYGARGISVHLGWHSAKQFIEDMPPRPSKDMQLDRIDNDGNYEPGNVRWVTRKENTRNRRCTRMIEYKGKTVPLSAVAEELGINRMTILWRIKHGHKDPFRLPTKRRQGGAA